LDHPPSRSSPSPSADDANKTQSFQSMEDSTESGVNDLSKELAQFSFGVPRGVHFGESSNIMLMKVTMDQRRPGSNLPDWNAIFARVRRPEIWERNLVSDKT
jgi:hypothetical protein